MRKATWLCSRSQACWYQEVGLISNMEVIEPNVMIKKSKQCPEGYEICRIRATILKEDYEQFKFRHSKGDSDGYQDQGYFNEWTWEKEI